MTASKLSVLAIAHRIPYPPIDGGRKAMLGMLKALARHDAIDLTSLVLVDEREPETSLSMLAKQIGTVHFSRHDQRNHPVDFALGWVFGSAPYSLRKYMNRRALSQARRIVREKAVRVIYLEHLHSFWIGHALKAEFPHLRIVLRQHNVEALVLERISAERGSSLRRWLFRDQAQRMARVEQKILSDCDHIFAISERDRELFIERYGTSPSRLSTIAVGLDTIPALRNARETANKPRRVALFVGSMEWEPNRVGIAWFEREVAPLLLAHEADVRIQLIGKGTEIFSHKFPQLIGAAGFVDDIEPMYAEADLAIVPLHSGSGIRIKILDFMARRIPIVSTAVGIEGIATIEDHERIALIADEPRAFADAILRLLADAELRRRLSDTAYTHVQSRYNWLAIADRVAEVFQQVCRSTA